MNNPTVQDIFQHFYPAYLEKYSPSWEQAKAAWNILNPVIYSNQKQLYDTLYHAASATINELAADPKHLGASVGYICILHTWGSEMNFHPHIHTILLGGGLTPKNEWKDNGTEFFLPIWVISKVFHGKYMDELKNLWNTNQLEFHGTAEKYRNSNFPH